jgi:hypothetical protein
VPSSRPAKPAEGAARGRRTASRRRAADSVADTDEGGAQPAEVTATATAEKKRRGRGATE